jgi:hypothetical protein
MNLFGKRAFAWNEPLFFLQKIRTWRDWFTIGGPLIGFGLVVSLILFLAGSSWWLSLSLGLGFGLLCWFAIEFGAWQRRAELEESAIRVYAGGGKLEMQWHYPLALLSDVAISRKGERDPRFAFLHFVHNGSFAAVGLSDDIRLERLALALHRLNVPVSLSGWLPPNELHGLENEFAFAPDCHKSEVPVRVTAIPQSDRCDPGPGEMISALVVALGPLLLFVISLIAIVVWAIMNWKDVTSLHFVGAIVFFIAGAWLTGTYYESVGEYWANRILMSATLARLRKRAGVIVDIDHAESVPVSLYAKSAWGETLLKSADYGLLYADANRGMLLYEGNKERMEIPKEAIQTIRIQEVQHGGAGETAFGELRCFVAIAMNRPDWPEEVGLVTATPMRGKNTDARRFRVAGDLYDRIVRFCGGKGAALAGEG